LRSGLGSGWWSSCSASSSSAPVAGIAAILVGVIACGLAFAAAIKQADISR
jgi:hypothetical protein